MCQGQQKSQASELIQDGSCHGFQVDEFPLALNTPAVARNRTIGLDHPVAGNGDRQHIGSACSTHILGGGGQRQRFGDLAIGDGLADRNIAQGLPHGLFLRRTANIERQVQPLVGASRKATIWPLCPQALSRQQRGGPVERRRPVRGGVRPGRHPAESQRCPFGGRDQHHAERKFVECEADFLDRVLHNCGHLCTYFDEQLNCRGSKCR